MRAALPEAQILLFPSAVPADLPALARAGILLSLHNRASLDAVLENAPTARVWVKLDCGLHRYGFDDAGLAAVLTALDAGKLPGLQGVYTHVSQSSAATTTDDALAMFDRRLSRIRAACGRAVPGMVAASPLLLTRPSLHHLHIDPGRALYGMVQPLTAPRLRPVVRAIRSILLDTHTLDGSGPLGYGAATGPSPTRVGTIPIGHFDGLPARAPFGQVLIRGRAVPVVARTLLASMVNLSDHDECQDGDPVTLLGKDGDDEISVSAFADSLGMSITEMHFAIIRAIPKSESRNP